MLDYETRKQLEEAWLCEMAMTRQQAMKQCTNLTDMFMVHLAKCFLFHNTQWYNHWLKECGNCCIKCDDIRLKPYGKRPDASFFMRDNCICEEWETAHDIESALDRAIVKCPEIERDLSTAEEASRFLDMWNELRIELADYFSDEDSFDRSTYINIIDNAIKRHS